MEHLSKKVWQNGISYTLVGDYYIPDIQLLEENRPIGIWGWMHKAYLELYHPVQYTMKRSCPSQPCITCICPVRRFGR